MFKRILKILGICLGIFVVVCGGGFGIFALTGGFKNEEVFIKYLYIDNESKAGKETIYTLSDFTTRINFEPYNATDTELEVIIQDPLRIEDKENGELVQEGILKNVPSTITAGKDFNIEINKDSYGNNYGGAVTLTFKPKNKSIAYFTLKVVVDVAIPNNSLYFAGNNGDTYSTVSGKTITMGISNSEKSVYLKSNLVNAFCLEADNKNLKNATISYVYQTLDGKRYYDMTSNTFVETSTPISNVFENLTPELDEGHKYYFIKIPVTPRESGTITMSAKMHKTYEIEKDYIDGGFDNIEEPTSTNVAAQLKLDKYNEFLNKYIEYFDTTDESYEFFRSYMKDDDKIYVPYKNVSESRKYIFQTATSVINISAVNLDYIKSTDVPQEFKVFTSETYSIDNMIEKFGLDIELDEDNVAQVSKEKANLFSTLQVSPYIYLEKSEYIKEKDSLWQNYGIVLGVTDFTSDGKPVVSETTITVENVEDDSWLGFLIALSDKSSYKEYISSTLKNDAENKVWTLEFNTPLTQNNTETSIKTASKALFLQFQVTGRNLKTNEKIVRDAYTRIYINYDEYEYIDSDTAKITFDNTLKRMSINDKVLNAQSYGYTDKLNTQSISISLNNCIKNYDSVQYKSIMYFVERDSNKIENGGGSKLATIGSYKFRYPNNESIKKFGTEEELVGERLLNYGTVENPDYRLYAINASNEPARIFAIVYLSDKNGNPIDVNGRPISINESIVGGEETTLVVFAATDTTQEGMASVTIDNFVNNINYYTISKIGYDISEDVAIDGDEENLETITFSVTENAYVKRNKIDTYIDVEKNISFSSEKLKELQDFLKLKLLYKNKISLYATNFELNSDGSISDSDKINTTLYLDVKDFYGNVIEDKAYDINTYQNKQLALNKMTEDFDDNYYLNIQTTNASAVQNTEIVRSAPADDTSEILGIKFEIVAEGKKTSDDGYIYIKAKNNVANSLDVNRKDYVSWEVNKLVVEDIDLFELTSENNMTELNTYNKLYSNYSSNSSANQLFGEVKFSDAFSFEPYYLYEYYKNDGLGFVKNSTDDNVYFVVKTNLYIVNEDNIASVNLDLVDMSQAVYENSNEEDTDTAEDLFGSIYDYIEYYTKNTHTMSVSYLNPEGVAQLKSDLYFPSEDNYICVGSKKYKKITGSVWIDGVKYDKYIVAGGRKYGVQKSTDDINFKGEDVVIIKSGEYFPIVKNYKVNGKSVVIICDEEFVIEDSNDVTEVNSGIIYNISDKSTGRHRVVKISKFAQVNGQTYDVNSYIDDTNTALEKQEDSGLVKNATIKFIKGGILKDENNEDQFVLDENGKYYFNTTTRKYEICPDNTAKELRYSKKGIIAYLMITYNFSSLYNGESVKPITKVITYELNQEPVTLVATGNVLNSAGGVVLKSKSEPTDKIIINAGTTTEFKLSNVSSSSATNSQNSISIVGASYERSFFYHCKFKIDDGASSSSGIYFLKENDSTKYYELTIDSLNSPITVFVPDKYSKSVANIIISYEENDETIERCLRLDITPNYQFSSKNVEGIEYNDGKYNISIDQNTTMSVQDLMSNYFELTSTNNNSLQFKLVNKDNTNKYAKVSGDSLVIGKSYAYISNNRIIRDYVQFDIYIVDGDKEIKIDNYLNVTIIPQYIIGSSVPSVACMTERPS